MAENHLIIGKIEKLENHFETYKNDMKDVKDGMKDLRTAIVGNDVNGNKGFLHLVNELDKKVDALQEKNLLLEENMKSVKFVARGFVAAIITFIFWMFQKN